MLAPPNSGGRPRAEAGEDGAGALDLERMLKLQADTIEAQARAVLIQQLAECRQLWPGGAAAAARLEAAIKAMGADPPALAQRDRRAAVLRFCARG